MKKIAVPLVLVMLSVVALCIGAGFAFQASYTDQTTSPGTINVDPAYVSITSGDWKSQTGVSSEGAIGITFYDPEKGSTIHPEFTFSSMQTNLSSYSYIQIKMGSTTECNDYTFYADTSNVSGSSAGSYSIKIIGTMMELGSNSNTWTGYMKVILAGKSSSTVLSDPSIMGSSANLTIESYHLEV